MRIEYDEISSDIEEQSEHENLAPADVATGTTTYISRSFTGFKDFSKDFVSLSAIALPTAAAYTFSIEQIAAGIISLHINSDDSHAAATILFQTFMGTIIRVSLAPLYSVGLNASSKFGELRKAENAEAPDQSLIQQKRIEIANLYKAGLIKSVVIAIPPTLALIFSEQILNGLGQSPEVSVLAASFLRPFSISAPALSLRLCLGQIMFADSNPAPAMIIGLVTFGIGTGMSVWLANGGLGMQPHYLNGIAWGINIESYLTVSGYAAFILMHNRYASIPFLNFLNFNWPAIRSELGNLISVAGPLTITMLVESALTFSMSLFAGRLGIQDQAALSYAMQVVFFVFLGLMAYGQATSLTVGRYKGAENYEMASRIARNGLITTVVAGVPACLVVIFAPQFLYKTLNIQGDELQSEVIKLTPLILAGATAMAARYNVNQVLRVLGDHKGSTLISALGMASSIALGGALGLETDAAIFGIAAALLIGEGISLVGLLPRWQARTAPEMIRAVQLEPQSAEPQTWSGYVCSFFRRNQAGTQNTQPIQITQLTATETTRQYGTFDNDAGSLNSHRR